MPDPLVTNAADEGQVKSAGIKEKIGRDRDLDDMKKVLATDFGRRFVWRLLSRAKVFESIFETSSKIYYNAGIQDFGHYLVAEVVDANPDAYIQMMLDSRAEREPQIKKEKQ